MTSTCLYWRVDLGTRENPGIALAHLADAINANKPPNYIVLHQMRSEKYLVVSVDAWLADKRNNETTAETALHQTAERFDTLEQAMLYFEMVRS